MAEILSLATEGVKKTRMASLSNTNFNMMNKYLESLVSRGFIKDNGGFFFTTPSGFEFLDKYDTLVNAWNDDQKKKNTMEVQVSRRALLHF